MSRQSVRKLADAIANQAKAPTANKPEHRRLWAVVVSQQSTPNSLTLNIAGSSSNTPGIRYLASYSPTNGDTVMCEWWGADLVVLGKLA